MKKQFITTSFHICLLFFLVGVQPEAFAFFQDSQLISAQDKDLLQFKVLKKKSDSLFEENQIDAAINSYNEALKFYEKKSINTNALLFELYADLSYCYAYDYENNLDSQKKYLEMARAVLNEADVLPEKLTNFYLDFVNVSRDEGDYEKSLGYVNRAKIVCTTRKEELINTIGLNATAVLEASVFESEIMTYQNLENSDKLLEAYNNFKTFYNISSAKAEIAPVFGQANFRVGRFYQKRDLEKAIYFFDAAERISNSMNVKIYSVICKGFSYLDFKDYKGALKVMEHLETFENLNKFQQLNVHEISTRCYAELGDKESLIDGTNKALTLLNINESEVDVLKFNIDEFAPITELKYPVLLNQYAMFLETIEDKTLNETADKLFKIGLKQFADRIDHNPIGKHLANYNIIKNRILKQLSSDKVSDNEAMDLISMMEQIETKAHFNEVLFNRNLATNKSNLDKLFQNESTLRSELTQLKKKQIDNDTIHNQEIFELELRLSDLKTQLQSENSAVFNILNANFTLNKLQIPEETSIIKFAKAEDQLFRITIANSTINTLDLGPYNVIEKMVEDYLVALKDNTPPETLQNLSVQLYQNLLNELAISENTIIITDAVLSYLPFELLRNSNKYLIEQSTISYTNGFAYINNSAYETIAHKQSVSFFSPSYSEAPSSETQLALRGSPYDLKGAKEEVKTLSQLTNGVVFDNENATKQDFINLPNDYSVIHLAGHAFLNDKDPELSHILFTDNNEDNKLYISELYGYKSNADLAVLSACNTGVGGYTSGKGLVSLAQAFMYTGIPSTVSSLWSAPDQSTKEVMVNFYKHLKAGLPKSKALQLAKLEYLNNTSNEKLKHPFYWGGFVLYGNDAPVVFTEPRIAFYYWLLLVFVLAIGYYMFKLKQKNSLQKI